jgi:hypothetical protein
MKLSSYFLAGCAFFLVLLVAPYHAAHADAAHADDTALRNTVLSALAKQKNRHFHFVQEKKLAMLDKPLITEGELLLDEQQTVTWDIKKPFALRYVLTTTSIREIDAQGERTLQTGQNPLAAALTQAMTATFSGQWKEDSTLATITATGNKQQWQLHITPRASELQTLIQTMTVDGTQQTINTVTIVESNGDRAVIHLRTLSQ